MINKFLSSYRRLVGGKWFLYGFRIDSVVWYQWTSHTINTNNVLNLEYPCPYLTNKCGWYA